MNTLSHRLLLPLLLAGHLAHGADFSFFTTIRAGNWAASGQEVGIGGTSAANALQGDFWFNGSGISWFWPNNTPVSFQIGYEAATNSGVVKLFNAGGTPLTLSFTNPGAALNAATTTWTLPAASFFVEAAALAPPTAVVVENLAFLTGVSVLGGSLPASLTASQNGSTVNTAAAGPIVFNAASSGGDWTLAGTIRFSGLNGYGGSATGDTLRFGFGATGSDTPLTIDGNTPEPQSYVLMSLGLLAAGFIGNRRASGFRK